MKYTTDQNELLAHLEANRDETLAWVAKDPDNRIACYAACSIDHWAENGVTTVAQYERYNLEGSIWDLYKDVNGIRPRWMNMDDMSMAELEQTYDRLLDELSDAQKEEAEAQAEAVEQFENTVADLVMTGAGNRETAIRWLREADGSDSQEAHDNGYFEYINHLPYGYLANNAG